MLVKGVMSKRVVTVGPADMLGGVIRKMARHGFSALPVVEGKDLVGIVTEADVIRAIDAFSPKIYFDTGTSFDVLIAALRPGTAFENIKKEITGSSRLKVRDFMRGHPWTVGPEDSVEEAARLMSRKGVKVLPVVRGAKLVGVIARSDIVRALAR